MRTWTFLNSREIKVLYVQEKIRYAKFILLPVLPHGLISMYKGPFQMRYHLIFQSQCMLNIF